MTLEAGQRALAAASAVTLWTSAKAPRDSDRLSLGTPAAIREWVSGMTRESRVDGLVDRTLTQIPLGDEVTITEIEDGWARVIVAGQPSSLDDQGYPGWVPLAQLTTQVPTPEGVEHIVSATATTVRDEPGGDVTIPGVTLGTRLTVVGDAYRGWANVVLPGPQPTGWVRLHDLVTAPTGTVSAVSGRLDIIATAQQLLDVPYVWGGLTAYGLDCSGLVYLVYRQLGMTLPRDAHDQATATTPITLGEEKPGDLYFFAHKGKQIHHIGIAASPDDAGRPTMIHAAGNYGKVVQETIPADRLETLVAVHRVFDDE